MSSFFGHLDISKEAVKSIQKSCGSHSLGKNLPVADLAAYVVNRDIMDVPILAHWLSYGQRRHFMRRFDGQSERGAYEESVEWIRSNALKASGILSEQIKFYREIPDKTQIAAHSRASISLSCKLAPTPPGFRRSSIGRQIMGGEPDNYDDVANDVNWENIGNALHALQDSFSLGHAVREESGTEDQPGSIVRVKVYQGEDKNGHSEFDDQWKLGDKDQSIFSLKGKQAINASKALIIIIINTGIFGNGKKPAQLLGWQAFINQWLAASPKLK